eukprot:2377222-Pyramimonas_sp.AAC.1
MRGIDRWHAGAILWPCLRHILDASRIPTSPSSKDAQTSCPDQGSGGRGQTEKQEGSGSLHTPTGGRWRMNRRKWGRTRRWGMGGEEKGGTGRTEKR